MELVYEHARMFAYLKQTVNVRVRVSQPTRMCCCVPANILYMSSVTDLMSEVGLLSTNWLKIGTVSWGPNGLLALMHWILDIMDNGNVCGTTNWRLCLCMPLQEHSQISGMRTQRYWWSGVLYVQIQSVTWSCSPLPAEPLPFFHQSQLMLRPHPTSVNNHFKKQEDVFIVHLPTFRLLTVKPQLLLSFAFWQM